MTTWEACNGESGGHTKCKEMWFDTREVLGEVCAFCGKGRECPLRKRSVESIIAVYTYIPIIPWGW